MPTTSPASQPTPVQQRVRPLAALRAIRALLANPDDTSQVFRIIESLAGNSFERRVFRRFRRSETGARILAERRNLLAVLEDREYLASLPVGSLGHCYFEFMTREQISAGGLAEAGAEGRTQALALDPDRRLVGDRLRDMHDLWHLVTGYGRDLIGEASLLSFTYAQTRNRGIGAIVLVAWLRAKGDFKPVRRLIRDAYRRGRRSEWLPGQDWEQLLMQPLEQVRQQLRVGDPPQYLQLRSSGAPALAS